MHFILKTMMCICLPFGILSLYSFFLNKPSVFLIGVQVLVGKIAAILRDLWLCILIALGFSVYAKPSMLVFSKEMMVAIVSKRERRRFGSHATHGHAN